MTERTLERAPDASPQPGRAGPARGMAPGALPAAAHELFAVAGRRHRSGDAEIKVGAADDPLEAQADRVAERMMQAPGPGSPQRTDRAAVPSGRRRSSTGGNVAPAIVHHVLDSPGMPLDATTRAFFEPRFGADLSSVRVHRDATAAASARAVDALAYTVGSQIVFADGAYAPETNDGQKLLAHELAHVLQERTTPGRRRSCSVSPRDRLLPPVTRS